MGTYVGIRFKGVVKNELRKGFEDIALYGEWSDSDNTCFKEFGRHRNASFIPAGVLCYMPNYWDDSCDFGLGYDEDTGCWKFQCSIKDDTSITFEFLKLLESIVESVEHLEVLYERWKSSKKYDLVDGEIVCVNEEFIKYE